jgi:dolichyl-phosphate beta-glucosyltransferase
MTISIVIPAYNEAQRISDTLESIISYCASHRNIIEILIVLNNCTDETESIVAKYSEKENRIIIINCGMMPHTGAGTKGLAVHRGLKEAQGEYILYMDADNAATVSELDALLPFAHENDFVIGSRYVKDATVPVKQSLYRIFLSRAGNMLIQFLAVRGIEDTQCGFKLCSKKAVEKLLPYLETEGWGFDIELLAFAQKMKFKIKEVGIVWKDKTRSNIKASSFLYVLRELFDVFYRLNIKQELKGEE